MGPGLVLAPRRAQRNPSTTPTIGFSPYTLRHGSGNRLLGYAIGVAYIQICVRNGTAWRISRYSTFRADSQSDTPSEVTRARSSNGGNQTTFSVGTWPKNTSIPSSMTKAMKKSTIPERTVAMGIASRGKYTFLIKFALSTTLLEPMVRP